MAFVPSSRASPEFNLAVLASAMMGVLAFAWTANVLAALAVGLVTLVAVRSSAGGADAHVNAIEHL